MNKEAIEKAISDMPEYVPVRIIERSLGMPKTTLQKVLKGGRELPKKWTKPLAAYFSKGVTIAPQSNQSNQKEPPKQPKTNIPPMPTRNPGEDPFDFASRKNEWKKLYGI